MLVKLWVTLLPFAALCHTWVMAARFLTLADLAEQLAVSMVQARALVRSGEIPAIQVGGRGQWRIEASVLEDYIQRKYEENEARLANLAREDALDS